MFGLIRLLIGCIVFCGMVLLIKKMKGTHKPYIFSAVAVIAFIVIIAFLPFENLFVTFPSPESAYRYVHFGDNVSLIVEGKNSDLVIGEKDDTNVYLIVPKTENGWKIGLGRDTKMVSQNIFGDIIVYVYQYKDTDDYFITVFDTNGGSAEVTDSRNSKFTFLERPNNALGKIFVTYYASILKPDTQYWINVNGVKITPLDS